MAEGAKAYRLWRFPLLLLNSYRGSTAFRFVVSHIYSSTKRQQSPTQAVKKNEQYSESPIQAPTGVTNTFPTKLPRGAYFCLIYFLYQTVKNIVKNPEISRKIFQKSVDKPCQ